MNLGEKIAQARTSANMTQQELADALFVSRELVSKWENGLRRPDYGTVQKIAEACAVPSESILRKEDCVFKKLERCVPSGSGISSEQLSILIGKFLEKLPADEAAVFVRKYYLLNSTTEIAESCGMTENRVRRNLSQTVRKFKIFISEDCRYE